MSLDPRRRRIERRRHDVGEERSAGADEHDLAGKLGKVGAWLQHLPGRDRPARIGLSEPHAQLPIGLHGHDDVAVLDRIDHVGLAGGAAVGGRRFHDVARRPLGDPKRLEHEARLDLAVDCEQQRHAADHPVVVRQPVQEAETLRSVGEFRDRRQHAVEGRDQGRRRIADEGESGLGREARLGAVVGRREIRAEDDGTALDGLSKSGVAIGALLTTRRRIGAMAAALSALAEIAGRLVLLGKQVVEPDGGDVRLDERLDQIRHLPARPGPSADQVN